VGSSIKTVAGAALAGTAAGYLLAPKGSGGSGGSSSPTQMVNPTQQQIPTQNTNTQNTYYNRQNTFTSTNNNNYGSGYISSSSSQTPTLSTPTNIYPTQDLAATQGVSPSQSAIGGAGGSSGSTNWLTLALVGVGAYLIFNKS
jgi:hypothetical protein